MEEQQGQERPLLAAAQPQLAIAVARLERSKDSEFHTPAARTYHGAGAIYRPPTREQPSASRVPLSLLVLAQLAKGKGNGDKETTRSRRLPGRQRRVVPLPPRGTGGRNRTLARPRRGGGRSGRLDRAGRAATDHRRPRRDRDCAHAEPAGCAAGTRAAAARRLDPARGRLPRERRRARHRLLAVAQIPSAPPSASSRPRHAGRRRVVPPSGDGHLLGADGQPAWILGMPLLGVAGEQAGATPGSSFRSPPPCSPRPRWSAAAAHLRRKRNRRPCVRRS